LEEVNDFNEYVSAVDTLSKHVSVPQNSCCDLWWLSWHGLHVLEEGTNIGEWAEAFQSVFGTVRVC